MFFLAKELGMTIKQLTENLTREELIGWAGFFELKHELSLIHISEPTRHA